MSDYNKVKIGDLWLTNTGLEDGRPCRVDVAGLARLRLALRRTNVLPIEGPPFTQYFDHLGEPIQMQIFVLNTSEYEDLVELLNEADESGEPVNITIEGETGNFDLDCVLSGFDQPGNFSEGRIPGLTVEFRIAAINEFEEP